jgi:antagonist of KipI
MAYLLESQRAIEASQLEIITAAVCPGTIQLPPSGVPMVLMRDAQTTGGYPRVLQVLDEDLNALAQLKAGTMIKLNIVRN